MILLNYLIIIINLIIKCTEKGSLSLYVSNFSSRMYLNNMTLFAKPFFNIPHLHTRHDVSDLILQYDGFSTRKSWIIFNELVTCRYRYVYQP